MSVSTDEFNTGVQAQLIMTQNNGDDAGTTYNFDNGDWGGDLIEFSWDPITKDIDSEPISNSGIPRFKDARVGAKGMITVHRANGAMEDLEALQSLLFHSGGQQIYFTMDYQVNNDSGTTDNYQFTDATLKLTNVGPYKVDSAVPLKLEFRAGQFLEL